jgi:hypothetical protein
VRVHGSYLTGISNLKGGLFYVFIIQHKNEYIYLCPVRCKGVTT